MYEIKGFIFLNDKGKITRYPLNPGNMVADWQGAHELFRKNGIDHYLITLVEVK